MIGAAPACRWSAVISTHILALALVSVCGSCSLNVRVRVGQRPNPNVLETSLRPGESTRDDVRSTLGTPDGTGREMLPIGAQPRDVWSYYYEEGDFKDTRRIVLFVFFDQDRYDGYMWFSSFRE